MRKFTGHKEPIKNIGLAVRNSVKSATLGKSENIAEYISFTVNKDYVIRRVFDDIRESLEIKLRTKTFSASELWLNLLASNANPVDIIFPTINKKFIWSCSNPEFIPDFSYQTTGNQRMPPFDEKAAIAGGKLCDQIISSCLSLPSHLYEKELTQAFKNPKARAFAVFLAVQNTFSVCAYSPVLLSCFDAWVDELSGQDDVTKLRGVSHALGTLRRLSDISHTYKCPSDFQDRAKSIVWHVLGKLETVNISADLRDENDETGLNSYGELCDYLSLSQDEVIKFIYKISSIGNRNMTNACLSAVVRDPESFSLVMVKLGASNDQVQEYLRVALRRDVWFNGDTYNDLEFVRNLVDAHRHALMQVGYSDVKLTPALEPLGTYLQSAEYFLKIGYFGKTPVMDAGMFLSRCDEGIYGQISGDDILERKAKVLVELGQMDFVKDQLSKYLSKQRVTNKDIGNEFVLKYMLENGHIDANEILTTNRRFEKATDMDISRKALLGREPIQKRKAYVLESDLGI